MSMMWLCVGCTRENADNFQSDNVYLSFTVTHETNMNSGVFESDIYYYDIDERKIDKVAVVPYTSQYPLAVYEKKENIVYYSSNSEDIFGKDNLFEYKLDTKHSRKLTSSIYAINYIVPRKDNVVLGAIDSSGGKALGIKTVDRKSNELTSLKWDENDFIDELTYNPLINTIVFSCTNIDEKYAELDAANNEQRAMNGLDNRVYLMKDNNYELLFKVEKAFINSIISSENAIYYQSDNNNKERKYALKKYDLNSKKTKDLDINIGSDKLIYISNDEKTLFYYGGNKISKMNLMTKDIEIIYSVDVGTEYINNVHVLENN